MPQTSVVNEPNGTIVELVWKYRHQNYQWHTRIVTKSYNLRESNLSKPIIDKIREYNLTTRENDSNVTIVTLSILISDHVLKYFPYIFCRIFRIKINDNNSVEKYESNDIVLQLQTPSSSTAQPVVHKTTLSQNPDTVSMTVSSDSKPCLHSVAILLLFVHVIIAVQSRF